MNTTRFFTRLFFPIILFLGATTISAQDLLKSQRSSEQTFIYQISDKEALKIIKKPNTKIGSSYFHTFIDTYPTDSVYKKNLPAGHYLRTYSLENKQITEYAYVPDFEAFILNNTNDLCIQIYDLKGNKINNATVKSKTKKLKYDTKTQCYTDKKSNKKGLLSVTYNKKTAYYQLDRKYNNSALRRGTRTVLYETPLKYVWIPVTFTVSLPIDAVKSLNRGWAQGTIYQIKHFFTRSWDKNDLYDGYLVFNKPKYLPNDTIQLKAFIVHKKSGKPLNKPVEIHLSKPNGKRQKLAELTPYNKGAYEYQFVLHDSLDLKLDKQYQIYLSKPKETWNWYISGNFQYEDYELSKIKLDVRAASDNHYKNIAFPIFAKATDENDLSLPDARVKIRVYPLENPYFFDHYTFLPDTLFIMEKDLEPNGETEILIPDSLFPNANFNYGIHFELLTADNRRFSCTKNYKYFHLQSGFELSLINDSIECIYRENGIRKTKNINLLSIDNYENKTLVFSGETPCILPINPFFHSYIAQSDEISNALDLSSQPALIQCFSQRTNDSVFIEIQNPRNLHFSYNIYRKNNERAKGSGKELVYREKTHCKQTYFISLRYLWGGKINEETYRIPFYDKQLTIRVKEPELIYPGQTVDTEITVCDTKGKPVKNVDLTAYSITNKFTYTPPTIPSFSQKHPDKKMINHFNINDLDDKYFTAQLDYEHWKQLAHLDSIEFYRFLYPQNSIYTYSYPSNDSITQFSPFVVSNQGEILPIHVVYVDNKPVYFSWSTLPQPYSFRINPGKHQIRLRLTDREIRINNLDFQENNKLIFSLQNNIVDTKIQITKMKKELSEYEKRTLYRYIFPYRQNFGENLAYIQSGNVILRLNYLDVLNTQSVLGISSYPRNRREYVGPVTGNIQFTHHKTTSMNFMHEPFFEYDFLPNLLKMREVNKKYYPSFLNHYKTPKTHLDEQATSMESIETEWNEYLYNLRRSKIRYVYPKKTQQGNGRLQTEMIYPDSSFNKPLNILLLRQDDSRFLRVYPGNSHVFHDLEEGIYQFIGFFPNDQYCLLDSIPIKANGLSYQKIHIPTELKKDSFSIKVSGLIDSYLQKENPNTNYTTNFEIETIYQNYQRQFTYEGEGEIISGYVFDLQDKEPLIGATVSVKGTHYGTVTDLDGRYSIKVPFDKPILCFAYLGYTPKDLYIHNMQTTAVGLEPDCNALDEVVVIGYGVAAKRNMTGAVSTVLSGKVAGIVGSSNTIKIRGISSIEDKTPPLYILDGIAIDYATFSKLNPSDISAAQSSSIRSKFSDYAYWQPRLTTDKDGKASFTTTFPDDVTNWNTYVLAMNDKKQSGQTQGNIRSFKPWMAQLFIPHFLIEGDTAQVIGKCINYTNEPIEVSSSFAIDNQQIMQNRKTFTHVLIDTLQVIAPSDSVRLRYVMQKSDGFFDGEEREIPVFRQGLEENNGQFIILEKDTTFSVNLENISGKVHLYVNANAMDIIDNELNKIINYRYFCNEQLASKLKALLAQKQISDLQGLKFKQEKEIEKIIQLLAKGRNKDGWWGWWQNSETDYTFSLHILTALLQAKQNGFDVNVNTDKISEKAILYLENDSNKFNKIKLLKVLATLNVPIDYTEYIGRISEKDLNLNTYLNLLELKQLNNISIPIDTLKYFRQETLFGSIYFNRLKETNSSYHLENNIIQNTLIAYRILKRENKPANDSILSKIRLYLMENKSAIGWRNTYESIQIIETILPDILAEKRKFKHSELTILGDIHQTLYVDTKNNTRRGFPLDTTFVANKGLNIKKTGDEPIYLTVYQQEWNKNPLKKQEDFGIKTYFKNNAQTLIAGEPIKLIVELEVKKAADYVMINIPIPAGCSYTNKPQSRYPEIHREYFKHETAIFCQRLNPNVYTFELELLPRFTGVYSLNPSKVELMYFPTFYANEMMKEVKIN